MNIYEPDNIDVLNWLENDDKWPASDWDYYVMNGKNDDLVYNLANDNSCMQKDFFLHCLYHFIGEIYISDSIDKYCERIDNLLSKNPTSSDVKLWRDRTISLLSGNLKFDNTFWLDYMFYEDIKKRDLEFPEGAIPIYKNL